MSKTWDLYNSKTRQGRESINLESLQTLVRQMPTEEQRFWFAWNTEQEIWEPVSDVLLAESQGHWREKSREKFPHPEFVELPVKDPKSGLRTVDLREPESQVIAIHKGLPSSTGKTGFDRRRHPRFDARFRVAIRHENLTFRTFSVDVSVGGLAIEVGVPQGFMGVNCEVTIGHPTTGESVTFSARILGNRKEQRFFFFTKASQNSLDRLQAWLLQHSRQSA